MHEPLRTTPISPSRRGAQRIVDVLKCRDRSPAPPRWFEHCRCRPSQRGEASPKKVRFGRRRGVMQRQVAQAFRLGYLEGCGGCSAARRAVNPPKPPNATAMNGSTVLTMLGRAGSGPRQARDGPIGAVADDVNISRHWPDRCQVRSPGRSKRTPCRRAMSRGTSRSSTAEISGRISGRRLPAVRPPRRKIAGRS